MSNELTHCLRKFQHQMIAVYLFLFVVVMTFFTFTTFIFKRDLSKSVDTSVRKLLVAGDYRQAILFLDPLTKYQFSGIEYVIGDKKVFSLYGERFHPHMGDWVFLNDIVQSHFSYDVFIDSDRTEKIGHLVFYYARYNHFVDAFLIWLVLLLVSIPITRRAKRSLIHNYYQDVDLHKQKSLFMLSSRVAHDLRSPLSSLQAAGRLLKEHVGDNARAIEVLNMLQLSGKRLEDIANDLLDRNKDGRGPQKAFSIHEVLDELVGELKSSPLGAGTEFKKNYHSSALYISGDKTGISRAVGNIIKNALEAMQKNPTERPRQLTISTSFELPPHPPAPFAGCPLPPGEGVTVRIMDTGPGIPADKIPLILQGGHTEGKADGHGIGTRVVKEMVEAHKGSLAIESDVGVGTTFILTLPAADLASIPHEAATVTIPLSANGMIFVIDDEASMREQWRLTLKALGVEAMLFGCWEEFADCEKQDSSPEAQNDRTFIVDYQFNNSSVNGLEIIRRLKERGYSKFVMATAEYWKPAVKDATTKLDITLCPKPLPGVVVQKIPLLYKEGPGEVEALPLPTSPCKGEGETSGPNVLVIDDDAGIRMCWKVQRESFGIGDLQMFASMEECESNKPDYSRIDLAFIDKHIEKSAWTLDQLIAHLKQHGVRKVWIASGETVEDLQSDPACASADGIVKGKMPESIDPYQ